MDRSEPSKSALNRSKRLLIVATAFFWSALYLYVPILAPYSEHVGASLGMVGLIVSSYGLSQLILRIPAGLLSDRIGRRKPFIIIAFVTSAGAALWLALATGAGGIMAARTLSGVSATMWVVITVLFASYFPAERAGYAMSLIMFVTTLSQLASTFAGGLIAEKWGWQAPFWTAAVVGFVGLMLTIPLGEGRPTHIGVDGKELLAVGRERGLLIVSGLAILHQFNLFVTVFGFVPTYAVEIGASKAELGILSLVATLPNSVAALGTGSLFARRWSERQMVTAGFLLVALSTLAIPVSKSVIVLYLTQAIGGFGRGLVFPVLMAMSIKTVSEERRATAMGFFQSIYAAGMFAGPALSGVLAGRIGLSPTFYMTALLSIIGAIGAVKLISKPSASYDKVDSVAS